MEKYMDLRGTRTAVEIEGSGPPLLMLHGAEGSRRQFAAIRPELTDRYTVITYDQRDCGDTISPEFPATLRDLADDAQALLESLGHSSGFVFGTSFGGRVAQALAVRHAPSVRRLVLTSTWPLPVSISTANPEVVQELAQLRSELPASAEKLAELFFPPAFLEARPDLRGYFKSAPARSARSERRASAVNDVPQLEPSSIAPPTLLIAGAADRIVPVELTRSLGAYVRGEARLELLAGVGHLSLAQVPQDVARLIREFLA